MYTISNIEFDDAQKETIRETPVLIYAGHKDKFIHINAVKDSLKYLEEIYEGTEDVLEIHYDKELDEHMNKE